MGEIMYNVTRRSPAMPRVTLIPDREKKRRRYIMQLEQFKNHTRALAFFSSYPTLPDRSQSLALRAPAGREDMTGSQAADKHQE